MHGHTNIKFVYTNSTISRNNTNDTLRALGFRGDVAGDTVLDSDSTDVRNKWLLRIYVYRFAGDGDFTALWREPSSRIWHLCDRTSQNNDINSQLDATITNFIHDYNQLNAFRAIIISRNMLSWMNLLIKLLLLLPVGCLCHCICDAWSHKHQTLTIRII